MQDDLEYLHAAATKGFAEAGDGTTPMDLETVKMVLARTEQGMQTVAEKVLHSRYDSIITLPAVARKIHAKEDNSQSEAPTKLIGHRYRHCTILEYTVPPDLPSPGAIKVCIKVCIVVHALKLGGLTLATFSMSCSDFPGDLTVLTMQCFQARIFLLGSFV